MGEFLGKLLGTLLLLGIAAIPAAIAANLNESASSTEKAIIFGAALVAVVIAWAAEGSGDNLAHISRQLTDISNKLDQQRNYDR